MSEQKRPLFQLKSIILNAMHEDKTYLLGRVLTIVDASVSDPQQRKAMKDIIQDAFYSTEGRRWLIVEALEQFSDKFCKESVLFKTKEERDEFFGNFPPTPSEKVKENYFPEN